MSAHAAAPRWPHARASGGFTLIELLVAIAVMSMLALLSWRSLDAMTHTQRTTEQRTQSLLRLQVALAQWNTDLDALVETGEVAALEFNGQVLRMTRRDGAETDLNNPGLRVVAWARRAPQASASGTAVSSAESASSNAQWMRWQSPPVRHRGELTQAWLRAAQWGSGAPIAASDNAVTLFAIDQWQLFFHRDQTWGNPQSSVGTQDSSPGQTTGNAAASASQVAPLPNGVRLVLNLPPGPGLSGALERDWIRPTLEASAP